MKLRLIAIEIEGNGNHLDTVMTWAGDVLAHVPADRAAASRIAAELHIDDTRARLIGARIDTAARQARRNRKAPR